MAGFGEVSYVPPYFEQAKSHLKAYKEIWKLYEEAPNICQKQKHQEQDLKDYLEADLKKEIDAKRITIIPLDVKNLLAITKDYILGNMDLEPQKMGSFKAEVAGDNVVFTGGYGLNKVTDLQNGNALTTALNQLLKDTTATAKAKAFQDTLKDKQQNAEQFKRLLMTEIIEKVKLSNYINMKGRCDECPITS